MTVGVFTLVQLIPLLLVVPALILFGFSGALAKLLHLEGRVAGLVSFASVVVAAVLCIAAFQQRRIRQASKRRNEFQPG